MSYRIPYSCHIKIPNFDMDHVPEDSHYQHSVKLNDRKKIELGDIWFPQNGQDIRKKVENNARN